VVFFVAVVNRAIGLVKTVMKLISNHVMLVVVVQLHVIKQHKPILTILVLIRKLQHQDKVIGLVQTVMKLISNHVMLVVVVQFHVIKQHKPIPPLLLLPICKWQHQDKVIGSVVLVTLITSLIEMRVLNVTDKNKSLQV
jgi:hypothetical protein